MTRIPPYNLYFCTAFRDKHSPVWRCIMYPNIQFLPDGTEVKLCPIEFTKKPLYCSRAGKFYNLQLIEMKTDYSPSQRRGYVRESTGSRYPRVPSHYGHNTCHKIMALTWLGPQVPGMEVDHVNGDIFNWSADNLEWVTPAENRRRARLLRLLRKDPNIDYSTWSADRLRVFFATFDTCDPLKAAAEERTKYADEFVNP